MTSPVSKKEQIKGPDKADLKHEYTDYDAEDQTPYCFCRMPDNGSFMIFCEFCSEWYHGTCVGILERYQPHLISFFFSLSRDGIFIKSYCCSSCEKQSKGIFIGFQS